MSKVGVVGSGTMATGIIEVFAKSGFDVVFVARGEEKVAKVQAAIAKSLDKAVQRGKLAEDARDAALARITGSTKLDDLADVDLVVEAVVEELSVKSVLFENLDEICKPGAVLATTTSSLPVVEMAAVTKRPQDVVGLHFFNPAAIMKLVEVVETVATGADVTATALDICKRTGKVAVRCGDRAGFIVNALLFPYLNDAVKMLEAHYAIGRRHRHRDEDRLQPADGAVRAARRRRQRRVAGDPADAVPRVPRAGVRAGAAAGAPGHGRVPGSQDQARLPDVLTRRTEPTWVAAAGDEPSSPPTGGPDPDAASSPAGGYAQIESHPDGDWVVRRVTGCRRDPCLPLSRVRPRDPPRHAARRGLAGGRGGAGLDDPDLRSGGLDDPAGLEARRAPRPGRPRPAPPLAHALLGARTGVASRASLPMKGPLTPLSGTNAPQRESRRSTAREPDPRRASQNPPRWLSLGSRRCVGRS